MGKRVVFGGLIAVLAACGGSVDTTATTDPVPAPPARPAEQGIYQPPSPGGPDRVADGVGAPSALAMTDDRVVFTTRTTILSGASVDAGAVFVAYKRVGPALLIAIDRQGASYDALAVDATTAFVATSDARLVSVPLAGGASTTLVPLDAAAVAIATAGDYVYFATKSGAVARVAKKGGAVEPLATITGAIRGLQADDAAVYVATGASEETAAGITRVALDGTIKALASSAEPCAMIRDGRSLYWTTLGTSAALDQPAKGEVLRLSLDSGKPATIASGAFSACAIAADKDSLYFATTFPNALPVKAGGVTPTVGLGLMRAPIAGGEPVAVAQASRALTVPGAVAVDVTHVYWLTETAVLRLRK
jgi:hypothetical protein